MIFRTTFMLDAFLKHPPFNQGAFSAQDLVQIPIFQDKFRVGMCTESPPCDRKREQSLERAIRYRNDRLTEAVSLFELAV